MGASVGHVAVVVVEVEQVGPVVLEGSVVLVEEHVGYVDQAHLPLILKYYKSQHQHYTHQL